MTTKGASSRARGIQHQLSSELIQKQWLAAKGRSSARVQCTARGVAKGQEREITFPHEIHRALGVLSVQGTEQESTRLCEVTSGVDRVVSMLNMPRSGQEQARVRKAEGRNDPSEGLWVRALRQ